MTLTFHWFPPANGDSRDIVGGGHGAAVGAASAIRPATTAYLGQIARRRAARLRGRAHPDRGVVRGRLVFILSGYPHREEAYWFGEGVLPLLERWGHWRHPFPASPQPASPHPSAKEKVTAR